MGISMNMVSIGIGIGIGSRHFQWHFALLHMCIGMACPWEALPAWIVPFSFRILSALFRPPLSLTHPSFFLLCNSCVLPGSTRTAFYPLRSNTALMNHASTDDAAHDMKPIAIKLSRLFDLLSNCNLLVTILILSHLLYLRNSYVPLQRIPMTGSLLCT
jgi:hypothetical protein